MPEEPSLAPTQAPIITNTPVSVKELYEVGQKIKYKLFDKNSNEHWLDGVIHGIKSYENTSGIITKVTYLIDTGRNERVDQYPFNPRDREIDKRVSKIIRDPKDNRGQEKVVEIMEEIQNLKDLPKSKLEVETVRQPEQIELPEEFIRLSKR